MGTELDIILKKFKQGKREDLIPILQEIQEEHGYLSEDAMIAVDFMTGSDFCLQERFRLRYVMALPAF